MRENERQQDPERTSMASRLSRPEGGGLRSLFEATEPEPSQEAPRKTRSNEEQLAGSRRMGSFLERLQAPRPQAPLPLVQTKSSAARAAREPDPEEIHAAAREGTRGPGGPLPHREAIQRSFGSHDVSHVKAHID